MQKSTAPVSRSGSDTRNPLNDYFQRQTVPDDNDLIDQYKRIVYACANLNANGCARIPLKLYVKTSSGEKATKLVTKSLSFPVIDHLIKTANITSSIVNIEEVIEHPVLKLLERANTSIFLNGYYLKLWTFLYQEIVGETYWLIEDNIFGIPEEIWLLPTQWVTPYTHKGSKKIVDYYEFNKGEGEQSKKYSPERIISYLVPNLDDPYVSGLSALEAAYDDVLVGDKMASYESSVLDNRARPDVVLSPGKDVPMSQEDAERWERKYNNKFGKGKSGGVWVAEEEIKPHPISYPPKDLGGLAVNREVRLAVANTYSVPIALLESEKISREMLEAALHQHALMAISPRLQRDEAVKNERLLSRYDDTGRLFLKYDEAVPQNDEIKMQKTVQFVMNGIWTPNEARAEYKMPPIAGGDKLRAINVSPEIMRQNKRDDGTAEK